jgi:hypothetical protein
MYPKNGDLVVLEIIDFVKERKGLKPYIVGHDSDDR